MKYVVNVHQMIRGPRNEHVEGWLTKDLDLTPHLDERAHTFTVEEIAAILPTLSDENVLLVNVDMKLAATRMILLDDEEG